MREFLKHSWLVLAGAFGFGLLLATTYASWAPRIEQNRILKLQRGIRSILTDAVEIRTDTLDTPGAQEVEPTVIYTGLDASGQPVGYVYAASGTGFQDRIELLVGVDATRDRYRGIAIMFAAETPGFGDAVRDSVIFRSQFIGTPATADLVVVKGPDEDRPRTADLEIVSITGATITSESVTKILNRRRREIRPLLDQVAHRATATQGEG